MKRSTQLLVLLLVVGVMSADAAGIRCKATGDWNNTAIWNPTAVPGPTDDVLIGGGFTVTVTADGSCANLFLGKNSNPDAGNGTLVINSGVSLAVSGNVSLGLATGETGTVQFQTVGSGLMDVTGTISFFNTSSFSGYSSIRRAVNGSGTFAFSSANTRLVTVSQPSQTVTVQTYPGTTPPYQNGGAAINRYYTITPSGTLTADLRLLYLDSELNSIPEASLNLFRGNGASWLDEGFSSRDGSANFVELSGVSTWSDWTLGDASNPLPIQLASFTATTLTNGQVRLNWTTLTETNNYGFEVQKSATTPTNYQTIPNSFIPGHGTTVVPQYYTFTDVNATPGHWYYRLKQIDLDGTVHYSDGTQIDILTGVEGEGTIPAAYEVSQNYPNPFNPSTTIQFGMPERGQVTLKVFNLLGQEIATLVNGEFAAGRHDVQWNASEMSSGMYIYQLKAGSFVETRKLTLAK